MTFARDTGEVGAFLKARRAELTPREVGLPETGAHRKVAGLRREEVAQLAAISVDYYTRLEQGRAPASASVLATVAAALRLDEDQQAYLYEIAGKTDARPRRRHTRQSPRPAMRRLLDQLTGTPAIVLSRYMDVPAWNTAQRRHQLAEGTGAQPGERGCPGRLRRRDHTRHHKIISPMTSTYGTALRLDHDAPAPRP